MAGLSFEHGTGTNAQANRAFKKQLNKTTRFRATLR
jgi:hypothetical protein